MSAFRGLAKGYRFFKDGHVQGIEMHILPDSPGFTYVRAKVLPSMVKTRLYQVRVCLCDDGEVHTAYCVCPAGLGPSAQNAYTGSHTLQSAKRPSWKSSHRQAPRATVKGWTVGSNQHQRTAVHAAFVRCSLLCQGRQSPCPVRAICTLSL